MSSASKGITAVVLVLVGLLTPELARADLDSGTLRICRRPQIRGAANLAPFVLPAGSSFVERLENGLPGATVKTIGNTSFTAKAQCGFAAAAIVKSAAEPHTLDVSNKLFPKTQGPEGYLEADVFQGFR